MVARHKPFLRMIINCNNLRSCSRCYLIWNRCLACRKAWCPAMRWPSISATRPSAWPRSPVWCDATTGRAPPTSRHPAGGRWALRIAAVLLPVIQRGESIPSRWRVRPMTSCPPCCTADASDLRHLVANHSQLTPCASSLRPIVMRMIINSKSALAGMRRKSKGARRPSPRRSSSKKEAVRVANRAGWQPRTGNLSHVSVRSIRQPDLFSPSGCG